MAQAGECAVVIECCATAVTTGLLIVPQALHASATMCHADVLDPAYWQALHACVHGPTE